MTNENDIQTIYNPDPKINGQIHQGAADTSTNKIQAPMPPQRNIPKDGSFEMVDISDAEAVELNDKRKSFKAKLLELSLACCSPSAKKVYCGIWVTISITISSVCSTHLIKYLFHSYAVVTMYSYNSSDIPAYLNNMGFYNAPFFTTWFSTNWTVLFFPTYYCVQLASSRALAPIEIMRDSVKKFRHSSFTAGRFLMRCSVFCILWVFTNYMYVTSLRYLMATDVIALLATNVTYVYMLSWVFLHQQFVGLRIVAVIVSATGVALLAHMDSTTNRKNITLRSVLLATGAAIGFAVFKVFIRKTFGNVTFGQISLFFSLIGMLNATLLWPICLVLYFAGFEVVQWDKIPWLILIGASFFTLVTHLIGSFSQAITFDLFVTLGLITSVPASAAVDIMLYGTDFYGMKFAGIILIAVGFFLVMFPDNWPDYITRSLRTIILMSRNTRWNKKNRNDQSSNQRNETDFRTGYIRSYLRSPSGRVR